MEPNPDSRVAPPAEPILDTWQIQRQSSTWTVEPAVSFSSAIAEEVNNWCARAAELSLECFGSWVRPWKIEAYAWQTPESQEIRRVFEWIPGTEVEPFVAHALNEVRAIPSPLYELSLQLDLYVWFRTEKSGRKLERAWLRTSTELDFIGLSDVLAPKLTLSIDHSLCSASTWQRRDNDELHKLNQPLLEKSLQCWEAAFGPIVEVSGVDVFKYGFQRVVDVARGRK